MPSGQLRVESGMTGLWVALVAIVVALVFGGFRALTDGRFRGTRRLSNAVGRAGRPSTAERVETPVGRAGRPSTAERVETPVGRAGRPSTAERVETPVGRAGRPSTAERVETPVTAPPTESVWAQLGDAAGSAELGERATLVQFSSAVCAPCRVTRRVLGDVAGLVPGVVHLEVDAEHHLAAVRRLGILRTPTTLVLDAAGHEVARAAGAPRKEQVLAALPTRAS
jgi:thiol-disulfide isomerase/thioredoxin